MKTVFLLFHFLFFPSTVNLGEYISNNVKDKVSNYIIQPTLHERKVINYQPKDFEDLKKYLLFFCKVKVTESGGYVFFEDQQ